MWFQQTNPDVDGRRDLRIGEELHGISPHPRTLYLGHGNVGDDSNGFKEVGTTCLYDRAIVYRKWTSNIPNRLGGSSFVGFGLAICGCVDPNCEYPIPVMIDENNTLVRMSPPPNRP